MPPLPPPPSPASVALLLEMILDEVGMAREGDSTEERDEHLDMVERRVREICERLGVDL